MITTKSKVAAITIALLALAAIIMRQQWRAGQLEAETGMLVEEAATLREQNARLSGLLKSASARSQAEAGELPRLRGQAARVRELEQENKCLRTDLDRLANQAKSSAAQAQEPDAEATPEQRLQRAKGFFGRDLGTALIRAAEANNGNLPTELRGPLIETVEALSGAREYDVLARHFELVYAGSLRDVKDASETVLAREREPVQLAEGRWARLYVMADGSSRYIAAPAPDAFAAREKELWPGQSMPLGGSDQEKA